MQKHARFLTFFGVLAAAALLSPGARADKAIQFKVVEIGPGVKETVTGAALNDRDEALALVGGNFSGEFPYGMRSFLYQGGKLIDLKLNLSPDQMALKLTNNDLILGVEQSRDEPNLRGFTLDAQKKISHLLAPGLFTPGDVNSNGEIIGGLHKRERPNDSIAYWNAAGKFQEITLPYNDLAVVGWMNGSEFLATGEDPKAPGWRVLTVDAQSGKVHREIRHTDLWFVNGVRGDGVFVGYIDASGGGQIPFKYMNGHVVKLPLGAGASAEARAINATGAIVGTTYSHTEIVGAATLWVGNKNLDLNKLCGKLAGWKLQDAIAINSRGTILCSGKHNGRASACLLIPGNGPVK